MGDKLILFEDYIDKEYLGISHNFKYSYLIWIILLAYPFIYLA